MPASLVHSVAIVCHREGDESPDEVWRCGADEGDGVRSKVEASDNRRVEIVESIGTVVG